MSSKKQVKTTLFRLCPSSNRDGKQAALKWWRQLGHQPSILTFAERSCRLPVTSHLSLVRMCIWTPLLGKWEQACDEIQKTIPGKQWFARTFVTLMFLHQRGKIWFPYVSPFFNPYLQTLLCKSLARSFWGVESWKGKNDRKKGIVSRSKRRKHCLEWHYLLVLIQNRPLWLVSVWEMAS